MNHSGGESKVQIVARRKRHKNCLFLAGKRILEYEYILACVGRSLEMPWNRHDSSCQDCPKDAASLDVDGEVEGEVVPGGGQGGVTSSV